MKDGEKAQSFFTRIWSPPRTLLSPSVGPQALTNVSLLVADGELLDENFLICYPALEYLAVDTRELLKQREDVFDGADCSDVRHGSMTGRSAIGALMLALQVGIVTKGGYYRTSIRLADKSLKKVLELASTILDEINIRFQINLSLNLLTQINMRMLSQRSKR